MDGVRYPVVELRQYVLRPGQTGVLVELFDRELVETQESEGMAIVGQFRDLDRPDRFVWVRGFQDMPSRQAGLTAFYSGPAWRANSAAANETMIDVSDVLLLRPAGAHTGFPVLAARPPAGHTTAPSSLVLATVYYRNHPFDEDFAGYFDQSLRPALAGAGAPPLAWFQTEYAENTFPALPVRTGEHAFVWFARFDRPDQLTAHDRRLARSRRWRDEVDPALSAKLSAPPQRLRLAPTPRSLLR